MNCFIRSFLCALSAFHVAHVAAQQPADPSRALVSDAALEPGGILRGRVLDKDGSPLAGIPVVAGRDRPAFTTQTDAHGVFAFTDLPGGVYHISTPVGTVVYRLWAPGTAPPVASRQPLIVASWPVVQVQHAQPVPGPALHGHHSTPGHIPPPTYGTPMSGDYHSLHSMNWKHVALGGGVLTGVSVLVYSIVDNLDDDDPDVSQ